MGSWKAVSLSNELHLVSSAIEGVRRRAEHLSVDAGAEEGRDLQAIASQLTTLRDRLLLGDAQFEQAREEPGLKLDELLAHRHLDVTGDLGHRRPR